ncbi:MAG: heavy metal translocating P-type ATPase metal-binding domain-containing protein, partial [Rhizobacter sp.]|nr:heavy metal translocating P-type ATPase metal-binding domain-containing protein [Bacteriovorax sp.]
MSTPCIHCDQEVVHAYFSDKLSSSSGPFCCQGCLTVYNILNMKGLSEYYTIKKNISIFKKRDPVSLNDNQYSYLDDQDFLQEYSYKGLSGLPTMEFYLEGIHCLACLWI